MENIRELIARLKSISPDEYNQGATARCIAAHALWMKGCTPTDEGYRMDRFGREHNMLRLATKILRLQESDAVRLFNYRAIGWSEENRERFEKASSAAERRDAAVAELDTFLRELEAWRSEHNPPELASPSLK